APVLAHEHDRTHYRDRIQGVGERHQRSVQQRRDPPDHFKSDEPSENKNKERIDQIRTTVHLSSALVRGEAGVPARLDGRDARPSTTWRITASPCQRWQSKKLADPGIHNLATVGEQSLANNLIF